MPRTPAEPDPFDVPILSRGSGRLTVLRDEEPDLLEEETETAPLPQRRKRKGGWFGKLVLGLLLAVICAGGGVFWWASRNPFGERNALNVLVLGVDQGVGGPARSDTLLLARVTLRPEFGVRLASIPRDTRVQIPDHGRHKINAAMAYGGPELTRQTLAENFGVEVDRTVVLTSQAVADVIDAAGGVSVELPRPMQYRDHAQDLVIDLPAGKQQLNGKQSVQYLRWRSDGLGDLGRIDRQREFLKRLMEQALQPASILRWPGMLTTARDEVKTDLSLREMAFLGLQGARTGTKSLKPVAVPFRVSGRYVRIERDAVREALGIPNSLTLTPLTRE